MLIILERGYYYVIELNIRALKEKHFIISKVLDFKKIDSFYRKGTARFFRLLKNAFEKANILILELRKFVKAIDKKCKGIAIDVLDMNKKLRIIIKNSVEITAIITAKDT